MSDLKSAGPRGSRRRASQACLQCRKRKVRCDVASKGQPCRNCTFDRAPCEVKQRQQRRQLYSLNIRPTTDTIPLSPLGSTNHSVSEPFDNLKTAGDRHQSQLEPAYRTGLVNADSDHDILQGATTQSSRAALFTDWTAYPFLVLRRKRGCLSIPVRSLLNEFVREYFFHVHPNLPIVNEADFWDAYTNARRDLIELMLFQAMLFASCSFVSQSCIKSLGFKSTRAARAAFYQQAKTLYDLEIYHTSLSAAQSAILLTYYASTKNPNTNSYWLSIALHHARVIQAHRYYEVKHEKANLLKRIWWACICRDRLLSLGLRRQFQISAHDFDFAQSVLTISDFSDEIHRSLVYSADSKQALIQLLSSHLIGRLYQPRTALDEHKRDLMQWHDRTQPQLNFLDELGIEHDSTVLYRNLLLIYYYSAQLALQNHAIYLAIVNCKDPKRKQVNSNRNQLQHPVSDPIQGITECLVELGQRNLLGYLPITTAANITFPLAWYIIGNQIPSMELAKNMGHAAHIIFTKAMKILHTQYEGTDHILDYIQKIIHQLRFHTQASPNNSSILNRRPSHQVVPTPSAQTPPGQEDSLVIYNLAHCSPHEYVRISQTIDVSLAIGRFPERNDLPIPLQSMKLNIDTRLYRSITSSGPSKELPTSSWTTAARSRVSEAQQFDNSALEDCARWDRLAYGDDQGIPDGLSIDDAALLMHQAPFDSYAGLEGFNMLPGTSSSGDLAPLSALGSTVESDETAAEATLNLFKFDQAIDPPRAGLL
ncbi:fungal-specific transcription factor domain-containing protein [Aspergillus spectabilis]